MKKHLILAGVITTVLTTTGAHAVTKCVALNGINTTCTSDFLQYEYHIDWAATCTTNGVSTPISGIGICSGTQGASQYATATELDTFLTSDDNRYCWCRMISPAVSRWVFYGSTASAGVCDRRCAYICANVVQGVEDFRSALFGSLSD